MANQERDKVLLRMLKTPPKPHGSDDIDAQSAEMQAGSTDIKKLANLSGQTAPKPARVGKTKSIKR